MKTIRVVTLSLLIVLLCGLLGQAQQSVTTAANATVPPLIQLSNVATDEGGNSLSGVVNITFSLYAAQQGSEPLWTEIQNNIALDATGHYSVQLGITKPNGVPTTLFTTGEARWLGVQIAEQAEQPRVLLLSVPYALKAGDAATIGGLPPSAFMLASPSATSVSTTVVESPASSADAPTGTDVTGSGTADFIPLWTTTSNIANSVLFQSGTGSTARIGINTTAPATTLDVKGAGTIRGTLSLPAVGTATASKDANSQPLTLAASAFNSTTSTAANQTFQWQTEPTGNDTAAPSGTLNLLFGEGTAKAAETGLNIASNGQISFATGQAFPGVPQLGTANTFTANQTVDGTITATSFSGNGSALTNVTATNSSELGGLAPTAFAQVAAANTFSGIQTFTNRGSSFTGNGAGLTGVVAANSLELGGLPSSSFAQLGVNNPVTTAGTVLNANDNGAALWVYQNGLGNGNPQSANGIQAYTSSPTGYGIIGANQSTNINTLAAGVLGTSVSSGGGVVPGSYGVEGQSPYVGVYGAGSGSSGVGQFAFDFSGVWGDYGGPSGTGSGVRGTADDDSAGVFENWSSGYPALFVTNSGGGQGCGGCDALLLEASSMSTGKRCTIDASGALNCDGTVTAVVPTEKGTRKVLLYSVQSPENWFEDFGSAQLSNGSARIELDSTFVQTVNTGQEYHVFLTPKGDCNGLYVSNESAGGFEVHELTGGNSSVAFDYRITAKRSGYEKARLTDVTQHYQELEERDQRRMRGILRPAQQSSSGTPQVSPAAPSPIRTAAQAIGARPR